MSKPEPTGPDPSVREDGKRGQAFEERTMTAPRGENRHPFAELAPPYARSDYLPLPPMVDDIGVAVIEHGERGSGMDPEHPEACLCGKVDPYYFCDGPGVESLTLSAADFGRTGDTDE